MKTNHLRFFSACAALGALALGACASSGQTTGSHKADSITVLSREDGSGTRSAFVELFDIEKDGQDLTRPDAEITNSTAVMMTTVDKNPQAIGYISLGSMNDQTHAVKIDGVAPSVKTVSDGSYPIYRPFLIVEKEGQPDPLAQDFKTFILSEQGQNIIADAGYVPIQAAGSYQAAHLSGAIEIGGSSSVTPVMEKLAEAYQKENPEATLSVYQTDSSTGASSTAQGVYDIGMCSRELKPEETKQGLVSTVIANDGIAVIVHPENSVDTLESKQVKDIYTGVIQTWSALGQS